MPFSPIQAATSCIERSKNLLSHADSINNPTIADDLRRLAIVFAVTAVDSYMHWLIHKRISAVRKRTDLPKPLSKLEIPFIDLASLADSVLDSRSPSQKDKQSGEAKAIRPWVQVKNSLQKRLLKETFQSSEQVEKALSIAGINKIWAPVAKSLNADANSIKAHLNDVVHRRNKIVHEGDISRSSRPRDLKLNQITKEIAQNDVTWVEDLIKAIDTEISQRGT